MLRRMQTNMVNSELQRGKDRAIPERIAVVADDLTGACDSGVAFLTSGRTVRVVLDWSIFDPGMNRGLEVAGRPDVLAFTTETRNLTQEQASARVAEYMASLKCTPGRCILFKKIDSAARGHLGAETIAALEGSGALLALVTPAFPAAERTVRSGILSVRDCSGQDARISLRDQFPSIDSTQIDFLRAGPEVNLPLGIDRAIANGTRILICDADTQEDLERLAEAGEQLRQPVLWAGSAGLARALAKALPVQQRKMGNPEGRFEGRTLLFVGTDHPVTSLQIRHLEDHAGGLDCAIIRIDCGSTSRQEIGAAFSSEPVAALILTGGDTASLVLRSLDATSILLAGEIAPGMPWGVVEGGAAHGCLVITKSGGFGDRDALLEACEFSLRRSHEHA